jgi:hypothetical protein
MAGFGGIDPARQLDPASGSMIGNNYHYFQQGCL